MYIVDAELAERMNQDKLFRISNIADSFTTLSANIPFSGDYHHFGEGVVFSSDSGSYGANHYIPLYRRYVKLFI